jgi:predicted Zn-dependent peptidase
MNRILGDGTDSQLFLILREARGWTYGAYSGFTQPRGQGTFQATAEVRTPVTDSAIGELVRQLDRIRTETPPDSEITARRGTTSPGASRCPSKRPSRWRARWPWPGCGASPTTS